MGMAIILGMLALISTACYLWLDWCATLKQNSAEPPGGNVAVSAARTRCFTPYLDGALERGERVTITTVEAGSTAVEELMLDDLSAQKLMNI